MRNFVAPKNGPMTSLSPYQYKIDEFERKELFDKLQKSRNEEKIRKQEELKIFKGRQERVISKKKNLKKKKVQNEQID